MSLWRPDKVLDAATAGRTGTAILLTAAARGYDCHTTRSAIDGRYHTQVNRHSPERRWNVAAGTGASPVESWLNAYQRVIPTAGDPEWALACLQGEIELLRLAAVEMLRKERNEANLAAALDDLDNLLQEAFRD